MSYSSTEGGEDLSAGHAADRAARHAKIRADIERYGVSYTVVSGGPLPRYAYSIGLLESAGYELILAGASFFNIERVYQAMDSARRAVVEGAAESVSVVDVGDFTLSPVQDAGARLIALGAFDYYANGQVRFLQLIPAMAHSTIDVPDMSEAPNWAREPVWRWLEMPWNTRFHQILLWQRISQRFGGKPLRS